MAKKKSGIQKFVPLQNFDAGTEAKLAAVRQSLYKDYGKGIILKLDGENDIINLPYQIPSGSVGLDICLGPMFRKADGCWQTGYGPGRILEVFGPEGTGKTTLTLLMIANVQKMGGRCVFIDAEHNLDPNYARRLGVDLSKLEIVQPSCGEEAMQIAEILLRTGCYTLIVIDSVAALIPKSELEGEMGDSAMGVQARLMSQGLRKFSNLLGQGVSTNIFFTNQIREKIGVMFGNPETQPGGRALKFYASYRIDCRRGEPVYQGSGDDKQQVGHKMKVHVLKNKVAPPFKRCEFDLIYGHGIDTVAELFDLSVTAGIIEKNGAWYAVGGKNLGQGRENSVDFLKSNNAGQYFLYDKLLTRNLALQGRNPDLSRLEGFVPQVSTKADLVSLRPSGLEDPFAIDIAAEVRDQETPPDDHEEDPTGETEH